MHIGKSSDSDAKKYPPGSLMDRFKERKIIATLAAFAGSGVVIIEVAHHILVNHYHFPHQTVDICIVTLVGALLGTLIWRWFRGATKRPGNVKVEVLVVPLIFLLTLVIDLKFIFLMTGVSINMMLIGIAALGLGIVWIIFKSLHWAAKASASEFETSKVKPAPAEEKATSGMLNLPEWNNSIVVLPFDNISPEEGQDYFCDGMTEEIITDLSFIHDLRVISRSSAAILKGSEKAVGDIAKELDVQYVLEGSVRKAGNNIRITAQLIDARSDAHLWADKYSGTLDDVFDIQERVSRSIVDALKLKLSPKENKKITQRPMEDGQAYDLYLRARKEILSATEEGLERALQLINHGLSIIGDNELIFGAMGYAYFQYFNLGFKKEASFLEKGKECADKVFALNPDSYIGHFLLALIHWKNGNLQDAIREHKKTLGLNPKHIDSLVQISYFYTISGKPSAARPWLIRLKEIAPLDWLAVWAKGEAEREKGNFEKSIDLLLSSLKLDPENPFCKVAYAHGLAHVNRFDESYKILDELRRKTPDTWFGHLALFFKHAFQNKKTEANQAVSEDLKKAAKGDEFTPLWMAEGYALIDEKDKAIDWLDEGMKWGFINYPFLKEIDPFLENIRGEERFKKLMKRVKKEWENFEV